MLLSTEVRTLVCRRSSAFDTASLFLNALLSRNMLRILMVAAALVTTCHSGDICPPKDALPACRCQNIILQENGDPSLSKGHEPSRALYTFVECDQFRSPQALEENILRGLHRKKVDELVISAIPTALEHSLARLPRGWLKHARIRQLQILNSHLSGDFIWYDSPFEGQHNYLRRLGAHRCALGGALSYDHIGSTHMRGLENLTRLEEVDLSLNVLTSVSASAFTHPPPRLDTLILAWNSLEVLEAGAFVGLSGLTTIDLSHNLLKNVGRAIFAAPAHRLKYIDLSWNFLESLPPDFFDAMPALRTIKMCNNFLYSLPEKPWTVVWRQLKQVDLTGNYIDCDCNLLWLLPPTPPPKRVEPPTNITTTILPTPHVVVRKVKGQCYNSRRPKFYTIRYNIGTLVRSQIECAENQTAVD